MHNAQERWEPRWGEECLSRFLAEGNPVYPYPFIL